MGYTAFKKMESSIIEQYGLNGFPREPEFSGAGRTEYELEHAALRFIHDRCECLRFDTTREKEEDDWRIKGENHYLGKSLKPEQIPYNMEKDIDRLCLEKSLEAFFQSGTAEDAYNVYYCYIVMFLGRFSKCKRMVEFLSEYENNGSKLLVKHRDHFSHSVYVFSLGLAIYEMNDCFRNAFDSYYQNQMRDAKTSAPHFFLKYWGLTALFHDIGYPFELPFEQILSYYEEYDVQRKDYKKRGRGSLFFSYRAVETITALNETEANHFSGIYGKRFDSTDDLLAYAITEKLGKPYDFNFDRIYWEIHDKPVQPEKYNFYMDHAYFSAVRLFRELSKNHLEELDEVHVDCLTAIMLHNSLFKFSIAMYKDSEHRKPAMKSEYHPLAYLLMLCDELQCWDRHSYGRNTRVELHPMNATFDFSSNGIQITYLFDEDNCGIIDEYLSRCDAAKRWGKPEIPKLPSYSEMIGDKPKFAEEIKKVVDLSAIPFSVKVRTAPRDAGAKHTYLSESSFLHLFDFAVLTHKRKHEGKTQEQLEDALECLSLEYQLSHLNRAKGFAKYLNEIHCFYTDRAVSFELVKEFSDQQVNKISSLEHVRWVREHQQMGWQSGTDYQAIAKKFKPTIEGAEGTLREQMRQHKLVLNEAVSDEMILSQYFNDLTEDEKAKDISAMNQMLIVLRQYDGLRIYRMEF